MPCGHDVHGGLIVATEYAAEVVAYLPRSEVDAHVHEALVVGLCQFARRTKEIGEVNGGRQRQVAVCRHRRTRIVDADVGRSGDGGVVASGIDVAEGAALYFHVGLVHLGTNEGCLARSNHVARRLVLHAVFVAHRFVVIGTIAATKHLTDEDVALCFSLAGCPLGGGEDEAVVGLIYAIAFGLGHFRGHSVGSADGAGDVVAAIDVVDGDVAAHVLAVNVDEGVLAHIGLAGSTEHTTFQVARVHNNFRAASHVAGVAAAIDVAANRDLSPCREGQ